MKRVRELNSLIASRLGIHRVSPSAAVAFLSDTYVNHGYVNFSRNVENGKLSVKHQQIPSKLYWKELIYFNGKRTHDCVVLTYKSSSLV